MSGLRRRAALLACAAMKRMLPRALKGWVDAVRAELCEIPDDSMALRYALGSLIALAALALADAPRRLFRETPRRLGVACAIGATLLGIVYMCLAGAPGGYLGINLSALVIGLLILANIDATRLPGGSRWRGMAVMAGGILLGGTAALGVEVEGAKRWIIVGPIAVQPSLIVLPMMMVTFARERTTRATGGMMLAALALALQPDRAMAGALTAGMLALLACRREVRTVMMATMSLAAFAATLQQPDTGQAVAYVDQIIFRSYAVHWLAGLAVTSGLLLLLLPALAGLRRSGETRVAALVFGATWAGVIAAAGLANYPTPLVGYGGAAILGYVLSLAALPSEGAEVQENEAPRRAGRRAAARPDSWLDRQAGFVFKAAWPSITALRHTVRSRPDG